MCTDIFVEVVNLVTAEAMWAHFATVAVHPLQLKISGYPHAHDMNIIKLCCFHKYGRVDSTTLLDKDSFTHKVIEQRTLNRERCIVLGSRDCKREEEVLLSLAGSVA